MATYAKQPIQRIKWLKQISEADAHVTKQSIFELLRDIYKDEGILRLWRGTTPSVIRNVPYATIVYTAYPLCYRFYEKYPSFSCFSLVLLCFPSFFVFYSIYCFFRNFANKIFFERTKSKHFFRFLFFCVGLCVWMCVFV